MSSQQKLLNIYKNLKKLKRLELNQLKVIKVQSQKRLRKKEIIQERV
jgi:hypothetical protein